MFHKLRIAADAPPRNDAFQPGEDRAACGDALEAVRGRRANELFHTIPDDLPPSPNRKMRTLGDPDLSDVDNDPDLKMDGA